MSLKSWLHRVVPLMLLLIPSLAAAQGIEPDRQRLRTALDDIRTLRTEYAEAFNNKDAAAVSAMYADDGVIIQPDGSMLSGEQIRTAMAEQASTWPHTVVASDTVRVYGSTAVDIGTITNHPAGGGESKQRYVAVLRRGMRGWKVAHVVLVDTK
ncbi:MAG TPA: nuclear transport factor 2 family protein [Gemmatimonadales bacterium]|nr:nuclear transport factor 2 family protein [Gemmatimonadales bacterium]